MTSARRIASVLAICGLAIAFAPGVALAVPLPSVYVVNESSTLSQYDIDPTGGLVPKAVASVPTPVLPGGAGLSADHATLYVTSAASSSVAQFDIGADGSLTPKATPTVAAGSSPQQVAVRPDGTSVYVTNNGGGVSQYDVAADGSLTPKAVPLVPAGGNPDGIAVSPDGQSIYVTNSTSDSVSQYDIGLGGALQPKATPAVPAGTFPTRVAVSPDGTSVYVSNNDGNVSQYDVGAGGELVPKVPATVPAGFAPAGIGVSPDGRSVYVANQNANTISQYDVGAGGRLIPKATPMVASAGARPFAIGITPDAKTVYVTNYDSASVSQYDVGADGALTPKATPTVPAGSQPRGVVVNAPGVAFPPAPLGPPPATTTQTPAPALDPPPAPTADLSVSSSQAPPAALVGQVAAVTMTVSNAGPGDATGVVLTGTVDERQKIVSADPACGVSGATVTCAVGSLPAGQSAQRRVTVRQISAGSTQFVVSVADDQLDPTTADRVFARSATVPDPGPDGFQLADDVGLLPKPRLGSSVNISRVSGVVTVQPAGRGDVVPIEKAAHVPLGSIIDTTHGQVRLYSVGEKDGALQNGLFYDGAFKIGQITKGVPMTVMALTAGDASVCKGFRPASSKPPAAIVQIKGSAKRGDPAQNHLWGNGKGHFRTKGKGSYATVRGTIWKVENHCFTTRTSVKRGVVAVFDRGLHRTVLVNAGETYVAKLR